MFGFVFVAFYNCLYNCYTVLIFALLVANWPLCINKFDLGDRVRVQFPVPDIHFGM